MKLERSDIQFPLWRKKVDSSLFNKLDTPIPNWLAKVWSIYEIFGESTSRKEPDAEVKLILDKVSYKGWVRYAKYQAKDSTYKLFLSKEFAEKLKDVFVMSFMRSLEHKLRKGNPIYKNPVEDDIPFWEFLDIEFDKTKKLFKCKAHYFQKPFFAELFKQFIRSHLLKEIENKLGNKGDFKFIKEDWLPRKDLKTFLERKNIIYYLIDTKNKLLYIGESEYTKRILQKRSYLPQWDYFRVDCLPEWLTRDQRLELERLIIRSFASLLKNKKNIKTKEISSYILINRKIDR
jgi:hypothetical protein